MPDPIRILETAVMRRLYDRYKLDPKGVVFVTMSPTVKPVTQADELLKTPGAASTSGDLTAAPGTYVPYFTVPAGKRWTLKFARRDPSTGASGIQIGYGTTSYFFDSLGTSAETVPMDDLKLDEGDTIGMITTGNGADGAIVMRLFYEEEDTL